MTSQNHGARETLLHPRKCNASVGVTYVSMVIITAMTIAVNLGMAAGETPYCNRDDKDYVTPRDLQNPDVLDDLTPDEFQAVNKFLLSHKGLEIVDWESATINSSYILMIDLFVPNKKKVTNHLDKGKRQPKREAIAVIVRGDLNPPVVEEYIVSPAGKPKKIRQYKNPSYRRDPIPHSSRPAENVEYKFLYSMFSNMMEELYPLLMESYGLSYHNCTRGKDCLLIFDTAPRGRVSGERKTWFWIFPEVEGYYIHPLGLEFLVDHVSTDTRDWRVEEIVYNGQEFDSVDQLMDAYRSGTLKIVHINSHREHPLYSSYEAEPDTSQEPTQGPKLCEPEGKRFRVQGQHVYYQNWDFRFRIRPTTGLQLFDIKFDNARIVYEISFQEILVFYTGYGPNQGHTHYYDVSWFVGDSAMELARGIDCPDTAVFLDSYFWVNSGKLERFKNNICIFENNGNIPLRRHYSDNYDGGYYFHGGIADYHLVVRTIANVWNYDYVFDYIFYTNGAIEVRVSATGYVQASFKLPEEIKYGGIIHNNVMADLHQHIFNYKVDLDISGVKNRYATLDVGLEAFKDPWLGGPQRNQMKITHNLIEKETNESTTKGDMPQYHVVYNDLSKNEHGAYRSYRILNKTPVKAVLIDEPVTGAAQWAKYPIVVTKRKDSEKDSTTVFAQNDPWDPVLDFKDFINNESIKDKDLVAWVTMGTSHIPGTEDVPSTPTTWNKFNFYLVPHNYFPECPTTKSSDNVVIRPRKKPGKPRATVETYGRSFGTKCINKPVGPYQFDGMRE